MAIQMHLIVLRTFCTSLQVFPVSDPTLATVLSFETTRFGIQAYVVLITRLLSMLQLCCVGTTLETSPLLAFVLVRVIPFPTVEAAFAFPVRVI